MPSIQPFVFLTTGENNTVEACTKTFNLEGWTLSVDPNSHVSNIPTNPPEKTTIFNVPTEIVTEAPKTKPAGGD